jgi:hypothetical protein
MKFSSHRILGPAAIAALSALLLVACASQPEEKATVSKGPTDRVSSAEYAAMEAQKAAEEAKIAAEEAKAAARDNDRKIDRAFEKSQEK